MKSKEIRIPKDDWGEFCYLSYLCGFTTITGRMTMDGDLIVLSGVSRHRAEQFAKTIRLCNAAQRYNPRVFKEDELEFAEEWG